jgi:hypothetical protein
MKKAEVIGQRCIPALSPLAAPFLQGRIAFVSDDLRTEPFHITLVRTGLIALVVGLVIARVQHRPASRPWWTAFALWFSLGGHWVELFFLNWLRPRVASARWAQITGRLVTWLVGCSLLMVGARLTVLYLSAHSLRLPPWWLGGPFFVGLELLVHALPPVRRLTHTLYRHWRPM